MGNLKEVFLINIFVILGALILVSSENLIMIYLGLEMQNLGLFVLLGRARGIRGVEGALKFLFWVRYLLPSFYWGLLLFMGEAGRFVFGGTII